MRTKDFLYQIEPDATAAELFPDSAPCGWWKLYRGGNLGGNARGIQSTQNVLSMLGGVIKRGNDGLTSSCGKLNGGELNFNDISDTFLTLAAVSPLLRIP